MNSIETVLERLLFACRWLLAPLYLGLGLAVLALVVKFFEELYHMMHTLITLPDSGMVLTLLSLIDLSLVGSLLVMVMLSGYENFVSSLNIAEDAERPEWLGKLDANTLKLKVAASIVAISSIHLLSIFMEVEKTPNDKLVWYVVIHMTFVVSALLLAVLDRIAFASHRTH